MIDFNRYNFGLYGGPEARQKWFNNFILSLYVKDNKLLTKKFDIKLLLGNYEELSLDLTNEVINLYNNVPECYKTEEEKNKFRDLIDLVALTFPDSYRLMFECMK